MALKHRLLNEQVRHECNDIDEAYRNLGLAIVVCACNDYRSACLKRKFGIVLNKDESTAETFMCTDEPEYLADVSGEQIADAIRKGVYRENIVHPRR